MSKSVFEKDIYRYYGEQGESKENKKNRGNEIKYLYYFRKCQETTGLKRKFYEKKLDKLSRITHIKISPPPGKNIDTVISSMEQPLGKSGRVIINHNAVLGKNVNIATGVTIGQENRGERKGVPTIKDNVWIGTNAVIVGNVTIGEDVLIAPLTFVNFDVPPHSVVIGNPAKIIRYRNGARNENH
mgnify:CR=1 FL=1